MVVNGETVIEYPQIKEASIRHFSNLYMESGIYKENVQYMLKHIPYKVTQEDNDSTIKPITEEEMKKS